MNERKDRGYGRWGAPGLMMCLALLRPLALQAYGQMVRWCVGTLQGSGEWGVLSRSIYLDLDIDPYTLE